MIEADFVIVGTGLTGSTIARLLKDHGHQVIMLDRKDHIAGNIFDYKHESGAMVHKYGPHYFRCGSNRIWDFLNRFTTFYNWSAILKSKVGHDYFSWPLNTDYINSIAGKDWDLFKDKPSNFEEVCLSRMPLQIYEAFIKGYTEKQWGVKATELNKELASRITINKGNVTALTANHRWNALPSGGYTQMVQTMTAGIPVYLNFDYLANRERVQANKMLVFTGPIDEFFDYKLGKLKYRGQVRTLNYLAGTDYFQPYVQVNYPDPEEARIRTIEWKHLMPAEEKNNITGTVLTHEVPCTPGDPNNYEYPFPDKKNGDIYKQYRTEADALQNVMICGRLGEYRYYDMDQAIGRAMVLADGLLKRFGQIDE